MAKGNCGCNARRKIGRQMVSLALNNSTGTLLGPNPRRYSVLLPANTTAAWEVSWDPAAIGVINQVLIPINSQALWLHAADCGLAITEPLFAFCAGAITAVAIEFFFLPDAEELQEYFADQTKKKGFVTDPWNPDWRQ